MTIKFHMNITKTGPAITLLTDTQLDCEQYFLIVTSFRPDCYRKTLEGSYVITLNRSHELETIYILRVFIVSILTYSPRGSPNKYWI